MRLNRSTNSATEYRTVVHRYELLEPFKTAGRVVWKTADQHPTVILTRLPQIIKTTKEALSA